MSMYSQLSEIDLILRQDETLLRLLYYKSDYFSDDPLDTSKPNILDMPLQEQIKILNHRLKYSPVTEDLADINICRIIFFPSPRRTQSGNYSVADQHVNFDIFTHMDYNNVDMRLTKICDRINDLFSMKRTTGLGKSEFVDGSPLGSPEPAIEYTGYRMVYNFGSMNV